MPSPVIHNLFELTKRVEDLGRRMCDPEGPPLSREETREHPSLLETFAVAAVLPACV